MKDFGAVDPVAERDVVEEDVAADGGHRVRARQIGGLRRGVEDIAQPRTDSRAW